MSLRCVGGLCGAWWCCIHGNCSQQGCLMSSHRAGLWLNCSRRMASYNFTQWFSIRLPYSYSTYIQWSYVTAWVIVSKIFKSPRVTGELIVFGPFPPPSLLTTPPPPPPAPPAPPFCQHMGVRKFFSTHLGDLGSRSLSYQSGTQFTLFPR